MSENMVIGIIKDAVQTGLIVGAPILAVSIIVGLIISIFQATTQIQEQTLTFVPKLIAIAVVGLITGSWMLHQLVNFTQRIFTYIAQITQ
ncbi:flagellar biosynthesis protein FliQ [Clostridium tyrobutyricum]|jgi:flagellar biosynthetic protein FliQ|uniref:Flagellar biosynthetic protein FliQ n=1 Tax=Clostridium tyrobutyricum DIVETGP TaxID=1408889 RepID=W6N5L1_CLOTY|nr:flagellar biosynthesis protein FliQ [Clostridium tyrobutyricum]AND85272.1 flagellar biosynthetic protein FliQ [Clostridium tyrobutyricum]ANP69828.1 flagellar biosynthetic protein FliQ [Clostridium tyrobutyricum]MBR9646863.1 flagellar biosynthesis protein FliQ [Clostridium tyrobutyricum]MBV4415274.1 flagellar biosynthesis protein FliQ [Clostridium tyrobutyricum]MBV4420945.1 flagellar biosynthesis protein FliQ [Clostridium tyrobutyricum]